MSKKYTINGFPVSFALYAGPKPKTDEEIKRINRKYQGIEKMKATKRKKKLLKLKNGVLNG
mgnify:CR=1 FL=1